MADNWLDIDKIKKELKKAASTPVPFAFGVGSSPSDSQLAMSDKKTPEFLAKALKKQGFSGSKILVGTAQTDGTTLIVTCEKEVAKAKKSIKGFFKANSLRQKAVQLVGPDGEFDAEEDEGDQVQEVVESDEDEFSDNANWFNVDKIKLVMKKASNVPMSFAFGVGGSPGESKLAMHAKKPPEFLGKALKKQGFSGSKILVGTAQTDGTELIVTCEKEVPKSKKSIKFYLKENQLRQKKVTLVGPGGEFDTEEDEDETSPEGVTEVADGATAQDSSESSDDSRLAEMRATSEEMATTIAAVSDDAMRGKLTGALKSVLALIGRGDAGKAGPALAQLQTILASVAPKGDTDPEDSKPNDPWAPVSAKIEPQVLAALKVNHPDAGKIRAVWGFAQEKGEAGDMKAAKSAIAKLIPLIKAVAASAAASGEDSQTGDNSEKPKIAPGVAFTQSRLAWDTARKKIQSELESLEKAILDAAKDEDPEIFSEIKGKTSTLHEILGQRDENLMDKLDEGLNAEKDSPSQLKAYDEASKLVKDYVGFVNGSPLVQEIDSNPFKPVAVKKTLDATLKVLATRLAA